MNILVTGGAGYIGSHMVLNLIENNYHPIVVDNLSTGHRELVSKESAFIQNDIGNYTEVVAILEQYKIDTILHFAGSIIVSESVDNPLLYYENNTAKSFNLISAAVATGVKRFVFSSTAAVYGNPDHVPVTETATTRPQSPYGSSKLITELMLQDIAKRHGLSVAVLRYFNVAGADPYGRTGQISKLSTHLIKVASEVALGKRSSMSIFGNDYPTRDGTCIRDYIHVSDLVEAHRLTLEYLEAGGESFIANCGYGVGYSVLEVIEAVQRVSNNFFRPTNVARRPGDPAELVSSPSKLYGLIPWKPKYPDLDMIIKHALNWEEK